MRGDPPKPWLVRVPLELSTPHARGSTQSSCHSLAYRNVYPACAGIHPVKEEEECTILSLPRMRGDPPVLLPGLTAPGGSTPHARGSTLLKIEVMRYSRVYPACAGIHPSTCAALRSIWRLPRMRGDPPSTVQVQRRTIPSTPHARGSTRFFESPQLSAFVYPACAGIHL